MESLENAKHMGSVSTIRDETSLSKRNTSRLKEHKTSTELHQDGMDDETTTVNQNVRVVIRKISRSKEPM